MSIDNKKFRNNKTGEVVQVISTFEDIAILENKQKASVRDLLNPGLYSEEIDPSSFFSNQGAYNILAEKIKNIPTHMIKDEDGGETSVNVDSVYGDEFRPAMNESAIMMSTEEDERAELARKYGASVDSNSSLQRQNEAFSRILGDDDELPKVVQQPVVQQEQIQRVEVRRDEVVNDYQPPVQKLEVEDPIVTMFKKTKRNVEFKVSFEISEKIPRLDFIEMMEDSYEISMIEFLAEEFTNKVLQDPSVIKNSIQEKIKQLVYGAPAALSNKITEEKKENVENYENIQKVNDQITDSVTQVYKDNVSFDEKTGEVKVENAKKPTTRKPRSKKETIVK